jgi:hypothetical protein
MPNIKVSGAGFRKFGEKIEPTGTDNCIELEIKSGRWTQIDHKSIQERPA